MRLANRFGYQENHVAERVMKLSRYCGAIRTITDFFDNLPNHRAPIDNAAAIFAFVAVDESE